MVALSSLIVEHQLISHLVDGLEIYAFRINRKLPVDPADLPRFARVFREFTDYIHHEKEESILLPLLARNGFAWEHGALAEVRRDHRHERYLIDVLYQAGVRESFWSHDDLRVIAATALDLVQFQRDHLHRENSELFSKAAERLSAAALTQLEAELQKFDAEIQSSGQYAELVGLAQQLGTRYANEPSKVAPGSETSAPTAPRVAQ